MCDYVQNKVIEYDPTGKVLAEVPVTQAMSAFRLPNGHILAASQQWPYKVLEVDRTGKVVSELATNQYTLRATRR